MELYNRGPGASVGAPAAPCFLPGSAAHHLGDPSPPPLQICEAAHTGASGFTSCQQLPEFPTLRELGATEAAAAMAASSSSSSQPPSSSSVSSVSPDKIQTLITMYRAHCQRIMDSVNKFSFTEIPHLFTHFWQEIPPHIASLLGQNMVVTLIGVCDAILYRTTLKAILPTAIQVFPENVLKIIRKFSDDVVCSLQFALKHNAPDNLVYVKMKLVKQLSKMLKRRTSVNHLYQAAHLVVNPNKHNAYDQLVEDWTKLDLRKTLEDCSSKMCSVEEIKSIVEKMGELLAERQPIAQFCLWISRLVATYSQQPALEGQPPSSAAGQTPPSLVSRMRRLQMAWSAAAAKLLHQFRVAKAPSASSFHLVQLLLNEFLLHEVERLVSENSLRELMLNMVNSQATELSEATFIESLEPDFLSNPDVLQAAAAAGERPDDAGEGDRPGAKRKAAAPGYGQQPCKRAVKVERPTAATASSSSSSPQQGLAAAAVAYWSTLGTDLTYADPLLTYSTGGEETGRRGKD